MDELQKTYRSIGKASAIIIILTLADKLLAILKEILVAERFGISIDLDVFNIAYALPGIIGLIFIGAINSAFIPLYLEWKIKHSAEQANGHARSLFIIISLCCGVLTAAGHFLSPVIFPLLGYGFDPMQKEFGIVLEKSLIFLVLIEGTGAVWGGMLHAEKRFLSIHFSRLFINFSSIALLLFLFDRIGIYTLVWGFILGMLIRNLYMAAALRRHGVKIFGRISFDMIQMRRFLFLVMPMIGSQLIANVNMLVDQVMATDLAPGSVSTLRYAFRLNDMPIQIIIMAVTMAIFPFVSERAIEKDYEALGHIFKQSVVFLLFLTLPIICIVALFSEEIVAIILQRGAFSIEATRQTAEALLFYSFGLFFLAYTFINGTFFSALRNTKPLFYIGCASIFLNVGFNLLFMPIFQTRGIALSTTLTLGIISFLFIVLLNRQIKIAFSPILNNGIRITSGCAGILIGGYLLKNWSIQAGVDRLVYVPMIGMITICGYLLVCRALKTEELDYFIRLLKRR